MSNSDLTLYFQLLADIKERVRHAQQRAILSANAAMILMYWNVGRMIASRQQREGWGAKVIPRLAPDLKNELPEKKGFSPANLKRMVRFWNEYLAFSGIGAPSVRQFAAKETSHAGLPDGQEISAQPVRQMPDWTVNHQDDVLFLQLSWSHNIVLMQKIKDLPTRLWYARQTLEQHFHERELETGLLLGSLS